jgi:hypothetical protein
MRVLLEEDGLLLATTADTTFWPAPRQSPSGVSSACAVSSVAALLHLVAEGPWPVAEPPPNPCGALYRCDAYLRFDQDATLAALVGYDNCGRDGGKGWRWEPFRVLASDIAVRSSCLVQHNYMALELIILVCPGGI